MPTFQITSRAAPYNIVVEQFATYDLTMKWKTGGDAPVPVPMDGARGLLQVRSTVGENDALFEASTTNGRMTLHPTSGLISLFFTDADTSPEKMDFSKGFYDLIVKLRTGRVFRILTGEFYVVEGVSRFI